MPVSRKNSVPDIDDYRKAKDEDTRRKKYVDPEDDEPDDEDVEVEDEDLDDDDLDDEDDDEDPDVESDRSSLIQSGWAAAKKKMSESSSYTNDFKFTEDDQIIKFLAADPVTFDQHWLEGKPGKKSYVCLGVTCPLCKIGHNPSSRFAWPIINASEDGMPVQMLVQGKRFAEQLVKINDDPRRGPLDEHFYTVSRSGSKQSTTYSVTMIKDRDLDEDYGVDPAKVDAAIKKLKKIPGADSIFITPKEELREIARELS